MLTAASGPAEPVDTHSAGAREGPRGPVTRGSMGFAVSEGGPDLTPGSATRQLCDFGSVSQRLRAVNSHWGIIEPSFFTGQEPRESPSGDRPSGSKRDFEGQGLSWESSRDSWEVTARPAPPIVTCHLHGMLSFPVPSKVPRGLVAGPWARGEHWRSGPRTVSPSLWPGLGAARPCLPACLQMASFFNPPYCRCPGLAPDTCAHSRPALWVTSCPPRSPTPPPSVPPLYEGPASPEVLRA